MLKMLRISLGIVALLSILSAAEAAGRTLRADDYDGDHAADAKRPGHNFISHFENSDVLSEPAEDDVKVYWTVNQHSQQIEFGIIAKTQGWLALGLNTKLSMKGLDAAILRWDETSGGFGVGDYFATAFGTPRRDPDHLQNWELLEAGRNETHTSARLRRPLRTCDDADVDIGLTPLSVIYAAGSSDILGYHAFRGGKTISLLLKELQDDAPGVAPDLIFNRSTWYNPDAPTGPFAVDLFDLEEFPEYNAPDIQASTYTCFKFDLTENLANSTAFFTGVEPIVTNRYVHHALVFSCPSEVYSRYENAQEGCFALPGDCSLVAGWSPGFGYAGLPDDVGVRLGGPECDGPDSGDGCKRLFIMQVHYENVNLRPDVSGGFKLRLHMDNNPPENELSPFAISAAFSAIQVPANSHASAYGECASACTQSSLPEDGINIVYAALHAHQRATSIRLRHIRNGEELALIAEENHYDYAQTGIVPVRRKMLPGDRLIVECDYDSTGFEEPANGGKALADEMCLAVLSVYPPPKYDACGVSSTDPDLAYCGTSAFELETDGEAKSWPPSATISIDRSQDVNFDFTPLDKELETCYRVAYGVVPDPWSWIGWSIPMAIMMLGIAAIFHTSEPVMRRASSCYSDLSIENRQNVKVYLTSTIVLTVAFVFTVCYGAELMAGQQTVMDSSGIAGSLAPREDTTKASEGMTLVGLIMLFELFAKVKINWSLAVHHVVTIVLISLAHYGFFVTLDSGYAQIGIILTLYATTEQPVYIALLVKRLSGPGHKAIVGRCFYFAAAYTLVTKSVIFAGSVAWFARIGFSSGLDFGWLPASPTWDAVMEIMYPVLVGLLYIVQLYQVWVIYLIGRASARAATGSRSSIDKSDDAASIQLAASSALTKEANAVDSPSGNAMHQAVPEHVPEVTFSVITLDD